MTNVTFCGNSFGYSQLGGAGFEGSQFIMGDSFLRNAYLSYVPFLLPTSYILVHLLSLHTYA